MYLDILVKIPEAPGKLTMKRKGEAMYIDYEYDRIYNPEKKYNVPKRATIGKQSNKDGTMMHPNLNFLKHFPDIELPEEKTASGRSSCLRVGAYIVIMSILEGYKFAEILGKHFDECDVGLFLDLVAYTIICENNAGQYYPDYAFNHPLFTDGMRIYSDSKVSDFLNSVTDDQSVGFLNEWNASMDHLEKIYISYDSTNKNCQAGDLEMVEYGHAKTDCGLPVFNYSIAYDTNNRKPLFYEYYPGSIADVSQLQIMLEKAKGFGYERIGFILDRGYFSKDNIQYMDSCGYDFVMMVKGMASFVRGMVLENKGKFENSRECGIREYRAYGMTAKAKLYATDKAERYFHIFYSSSKECAERETVEASVERMAKFLKKQEGKGVAVCKGCGKYFELYVDEKKGTFLYAREKAEIIEEEIDLCGYFIIVTSQKMTAKEALSLYRSRDTSEKLFRGDKPYLGNKSIRVYSNESAAAKTFVEFVALIVRCKLHTSLKDEMINNDKKSNYMTVPAAIKELEKIEMVKLLDSRYRLDHAVTAIQKAILKAFGMDAAYIKNKANEISKALSR
jgi:transposase